MENIVKLGYISLVSNKNKPGKTIFMPWIVFYLLNSYEAFKICDLSECSLFKDVAFATIQIRLKWAQHKKQKTIKYIFIFSGY